MNENIKSAVQLRQYVIENQINLVYKKILESAIEGKFKLTLKIDFMLSDTCKAYFSKLGYNLIEMHELINKEDLSHYYEISWK